MEKIEPGKYVEFAYSLYEVNSDGTENLVYETDVENAPEAIIFGVTQGVFVPLEKALEGLQAGDTYNVPVKAAEAFGEYDPERVVTLEKQIFEVDGKFDDERVTPGAMLPMLTADGMHLMGRVLEVTDKDVKMDFNHMLAGKDVRFEGKVLLVRDATPEELQPEHGCGCGCGDCGDDCGCGDDHHHCGDDACGCH